MSSNNTQDVEKPDVLPASRNTGEVSEAATEGLPPGAYDPRKDETYQETVKSNVPEQTNRKEGVYGVGEGED